MFVIYLIVDRPHFRNHFCCDCDRDYISRES